MYCLCSLYYNYLQNNLYPTEEIKKCNKKAKREVITLLIIIFLCREAKQRITRARYRRLILCQRFYSA